MLASARNPPGIICTGKLSDLGKIRRRLHATAVLLNTMHSYASARDNCDHTSRMLELYFEKCLGYYDDGPQP